MKTPAYFLYLKFNCSQLQSRSFFDLHTFIHPQTSPKQILRSIQSSQVYLTSQYSLLASDFILSINEPAAFWILDGVVIAGPDEGGEG